MKSGAKAHRARHWARGPRSGRRAPASTPAQSAKTPTATAPGAGISGPHDQRQAAEPEERPGTRPPPFRPRRRGRLGAAAGGAAVPAQIDDVTEVDGERHEDRPSRSIRRCITSGEGGALRRAGARRCAGRRRAARRWPEDRFAALRFLDLRLGGGFRSGAPKSLSASIGLSFDVRTAPLPVPCLRFTRLRRLSARSRNPGIARPRSTLCAR